MSSHLKAFKHCVLEQVESSDKMSTKADHEIFLLVALHFVINLIKNGIRLIAHDILKDVQNFE